MRPDLAYSVVISRRCLAVQLSLGTKYSDSLFLTMGVVDEWASAIWQSEDDDSVYECQQCESQFEVEYYTCPDCGGYRVERTDWGDCD